MENSSVSLWLFDLRPWMDDWRSFLPLLSPQRRARVLSCYREEDSVRLAGAGVLLRHALVTAGVSVSEQIFETNAWGKPYLASGALEFSLSHAGFYAACAVGKGALGVDVEAPRFSMTLAEHCFHSEELSYLKLLCRTERPDAWLRIWTAKEAYIKYLGRGLSVPLSSFRVELTPSGARLYQNETALPERLHEYPLGAYRLCLCASVSRPSLQFYTP